MGLDMFLFRAKRIEGLTAEDYSTIESAVENVSPREVQVQDVNVEALSGVKNSNQLTVLTKGTPGIFQYYSVLEEVGYWRKANQIHSWFVKNVQDGVDECQYTFVRLGDLRKLLFLVEDVLADRLKAAYLLPTESGFFFGNTNYDKYYFDNLQQTKEILEKVLDETDWDNQVVLYHSSW